MKILLWLVCGIVASIVFGVIILRIFCSLLDPDNEYEVGEDDEDLLSPAATSIVVENLLNDKK